MTVSSAGPELDEHKDERRGAAREALWDWTYIASACVSMAATLWLAAAVWPTA